MDFGLLLLIVFILAPLLEKLLTGGKQQQPPEQQQGPRPGQRRPGMPVPGEPQRRVPPAQDDEELPFRSVPAGHREEEEAAAMLPDDLWEILTGEKRPQRQPPAEAQAPPPVPAAPPREPDAAQVREIERLERKRREEAERVAELRRADQRRAARQQERDSMRSRDPVAPRQRRLPSVEVRDRPLPQRRRASGPPPGEADRYVRPVPVRAAPDVYSHDADIPASEERRPRWRRLEVEEAQADTGPQVQILGNREELRRAIIMAEVLGRPKGLD